VGFIKNYIKTIGLLKTPESCFSSFPAILIVENNFTDHDRIGSVPNLNVLDRIRSGKKNPIFIFIFNCVNSKNKCLILFNETT
jgi:hypothetical protein